MLFLKQLSTKHFPDTIVLLIGKTFLSTYTCSYMVPTLTGNFFMIII